MTASHDQNFKNLILDYPHDAIRFFAAAEAADIDETVRITPIRQEQLKDRLGDRFHELDTPVMAEWPDGKRKAILFVFEEESDPAAFSIHRLGRYCLSLSELCRTDRIAPVVIFLRPGDWQSELRLSADNGIYLHFRFIACDLGRIPAGRFLNSRNIVARLNLPNMACEPSRRIEVYAHAQEGLVTLENNTDRRLKYIDFIDYYSKFSPDDYLQYKNEYLAKSRYQEEIMGLLQIAREEGLEKGTLIGIRQGKAAMLKKLVVRRFGALPLWAEKNIDLAEPGDLEIWTDRILDAVSLEDLFKK